MFYEIKRNAPAGVGRTTFTLPARPSRVVAVAVPTGCLQPVGLAPDLVALGPACCSAASKKRTFKDCQNRTFKLALTRWPQTNAGDRLMRIPPRKPPSTGCRDCMHGGFAETSASGSTHGRCRLRILGPATGSGLPIPPESVPGAARWRHQPQTNATSLRHAADQPPNRLARGSRTRRVTISSAATRSLRQMSCRSLPAARWPIPADLQVSTTSSTRPRKCAIHLLAACRARSPAACARFRKFQR